MNGVYLQISKIAAYVLAAIMMAYLLFLGGMSLPIASAQQTSFPPSVSAN